MLYMGILIQTVMHKIYTGTVRKTQGHLEMGIKICIYIYIHFCFHFVSTTSAILFHVFIVTLSFQDLKMT